MQVAAQVAAQVASGDALSGVACAIHNYYYYYYRSQLAGRQAL